MGNKINVDIATLQEKAKQRIDNTNNTFNSDKQIKSSLQKETKTNDKIVITSECVLNDYVTTETQNEVNDLKGVEKFLVKNSIIGLVRKANREKLLSQYQDFEI